MGLGHEGCYWNCGATKCTATTYTEPRCKHDTGWYVTIEFLWFFKVRKFVCSDCGETLPGEWKVPNRDS